MEEAELDLLRKRQIKDYKPALNSLTKMQDLIFKIFNDIELTAEGKCKIIEQLQERICILTNKFKDAGLPHANVLQPPPAQPFPAPEEHVVDGPHAPVVDADKEDLFLPVIANTKRKAIFQLTLSNLHCSLRI